MKPYGGNEPAGDGDPVFLEYEEYEAIRLCDHEGLNHVQASFLMNVSRPTLTRIYASARQKVAEALVVGKQLIIEGGKVYFDSEWHHCAACRCYFNHPEKQQAVEACPLCGSRAVSPFDAHPDSLGQEEAVDSPDDEPENRGRRPCGEPGRPRRRQRRIRQQKQVRDEDSNHQYGRDS
jgi:predicted DNA-binding protein (UPF0251 family)